METTTNYKRPQWVKADQINMDDFNGAFANIDAALKENADAAAGAASAERVTALEQKWERGKVCRVAWGTYTGTGKYGVEHPNRIACDFEPLLLIVGGVQAIRGQRILSTGSCTNTVTWEISGVSWYVNEYNTTSDQGQLNQSGQIYNYFLLGCDN